MAIVDRIHLPDMASRITLHMVITGRKRFAARAQLGSKVLMLGAAIIGCGVEIVDKRHNEDPYKPTTGDGRPLVLEAGQERPR